MRSYRVDGTVSRSSVQSSARIIGRPPFVCQRTELSRIVQRRMLWMTATADPSRGIGLYAAFLRLFVAHRLLRPIRISQIPSCLRVPPVGWHRRAASARICTMHYLRRTPVLGFAFSLLVGTILAAWPPPAVLAET